MPVYYFLKIILKNIRWRFRRTKAGLTYGLAALSNAPIVFGNAMPKSGSHLLTQILQGLTSLGPFVDPGFPPVNRSESNHPLPAAQVLRNLKLMKCGDIRYGYLHACEPYLSILSDSHRATIFLYRDPRDMLVSHVFYATELHKEHGMHDYYTQKLKSMEQRLNAAIQGVNEPGIELSNVKQRYDAYLGWLNQPGVLPLKFEDLILDRDAALKRLLDYLRSRGFSPRIPMGEAIDLIKKRIVPNQSGTFRKGVPGDWREHFTDSNKTLFNQIAGNLLVELGYEQGQKW